MSLQQRLIDLSIEHKVPATILHINLLNFERDFFYKHKLYDRPSHATVHAFKSLQETLNRPYGLKLLYEVHHDRRTYL